MRFGEQKKRNVLLRSILIGLIFAIVGATIAEAAGGGDGGRSKGWLAPEVSREGDRRCVYGDHR